MRTRPVHWSEGLLLLPHHLQASQANLLEEQAVATDWTHGYGYGLRAIELNAEALANFEIRIPRLRARLRDGTLVSVPENAHLSTLDLRPAFEKASETYIHLLLPEIVPGRANSTRQLGSFEHRFLITDEEWEERHEGGNPRLIETERLNANLAALPTIHAPKGYESIPLVKLRRAAQGEARPVVDFEYIPPLLACDCWIPLKEGVLAAVNAKLGSFIHSEADYLRTHGGWSEANQTQIRRSIMQLSVVNGAYPYLTQLTEARGIHPFVAYSELCRLVGQLALFRPDWKPPDLPRYDHDDLGRIFRAVAVEIDLAPREIKVFPYPFVGVKGREYKFMEIKLDPRWLNGRTGFYVGVRSELTSELVERLFSPKWLDWKLSSTRMVEHMWKNALEALKIRRVAGVHQSLPASAKMTYFEIEPSGQQWEEVRQDRTLALIVNPNHVRGEILNQSTITVVDPRNNPRDLTLELYLVQNE